MVEIGDSVMISSMIDIQCGKKVSINPVGNSLNGFSGDVFVTFLKPYFTDTYRPIMKGNTFTVKVAEKVAEFYVSDIEPGDYCIVEPNTVIYV